MKKFTIVTVVVLAVSMLLTCCGAGKGEDKPPATQPSQMESGNTSVPEDTEGPEESKTPEVTIAETVVYDAHGVKITVTGMESTWSGQDIKLLVENSTDKNIALSGDNVVVNGVTMDGWLYIDVAAGKKTNGVLSIYSDSLQTAGIDKIAWLEACDGRIVDTDSYETLAEAVFVIETSLGRDYVQNLDESGDLLYEANGVQVIAKVITDAFYGKTLVLYVKNGSGQNVTIQAENISVNGFTLDAWMYSLVCAGTSRFCDLDLWESGLEENGITEIEEITFTIQMIDPNSYETLAKSQELRVVVGQ